jgi:hypothetical protein
LGVTIDFGFVKLAEQYRQPVWILQAAKLPPEPPRLVGIRLIGLKPYWCQ